MEMEMLSCFPNGIRILLVDDDHKFLHSVTTAFSSLHYNVATCSSPVSAVKHLSSGRVKDVDAILADAHKIASCGFNFHAFVENDLHIPTIYFMSLEAPHLPPTGNNDVEKLAATVQSSTFIIKKPLDMNEASNLWKVVAWHKFRLNAKKAGGGAIAAAIAEDHGGSQQRSTKEQMKVMTGIRRRHISSMSNPLEEYHMAKLQKNNVNFSTSTHAGNNGDSAHKIAAPMEQELQPAAIAGPSNVDLQGDDSHLAASMQQDVAAAPGEAATTELLPDNSQPFAVPGREVEGDANAVDGASLSFLNDDDYMENWDLLTDQDLLQLDNIMDDIEGHVTWTP